MSKVVSIHSARSTPADGDATAANDDVRDAEAFRIVQRGGRTFHVYGSGEERIEPLTDGTPAA
jgi:hypothetical protein